MRKLEKCGVCGSEKTDKGVCRPCANRRNKEYTLRHSEKLKEKRAEYRAKNRETILEKHTIYRKLNKDKWRQYYLANADAIRERTRQWRSANPDLTNQKSYDWAQRNPERRATIRSTWKKNNKGKVNAATARRHASKMLATPKWADTAKIEEFYKSSDLLSMCTGDWYHVDHIVPINGKTVCGLHVEHNLQVLTGAANLAKSNRHWPHMP